MAGIIPEAISGAQTVRTQSGVPVEQPTVQNGYVPPATFQMSCSLRYLPSDCTARIFPSQINALQSELICLGERLSATGTWNCDSLCNLSTLFGDWTTGSEFADLARAAICAAPATDVSEESIITFCTEGSMGSDSISNILAFFMPSLYCSIEGDEGIPDQEDFRVLFCGPTSNVWVTWGDLISNLSPTINVDLPISGTGSASDPLTVSISTASGNALTTGPDGGLFVPTGTTDIYTRVFNNRVELRSKNVHPDVKSVVLLGYNDTGIGAANYQDVGGSPTYGPNIQTNGGFATDTDWSKSGAVAIQNGQCEFTGSASVRQTNALVKPGMLLRIQWRISQAVVGGGGIQCGVAAPGNNVVGPVRQSAGNYVDYILVPENYTGIGFWSGSGVVSGAIDDVGFRIVDIGQIPSGDGRWWKNIDNILTETMFGIKCDGSNETDLTQMAINFAQGKELHFTLGGTLGYTFLIYPNNTTLKMNNTQMRRLNANVSAGLRVNNWFKVDKLIVSSPGGLTGDKALRIQGNDNTFDYVHFTADAQGAYNTTNWAIEVESNPIGTPITRNTIKAGYCLNYSTFCTGALISFLEMSNVVVENYRTATYFRDIQRSKFSSFRIRGLGAAVNGGPGENGFLLEARTNSASMDIVLEDWIVENSGEHAYRLGGQQEIRNVWFNRCKAKKPGSSILTGNLSSGEWHGGCGFKILGGAIIGGARHKNIYLNDCQVYDINQQFGSYPSGHGVNNFTPYLVVLADNVHLNNCLTDTETLSTSCRNGLLVACCKGVYVNQCTFLKCDLSALVPYQESLFEGYPGYAAPLEEFHVSGGLFEVVTTTANSGIVYYMREAATFAHKNWSVEGANFRGGAAAVRIETPGSGGSYKNCRVKFNYADPTSTTDAASTTQLTAGGGATSFIFEIEANNRPSAAGPAAANGSTYRKLDTGDFQLRKANNWATL